MTFKPLLAGLAMSASAICAPAFADQGVTDDKVVVGHISDLSGPLASWGVAATNAAKMRFDEANEAGGVHGRQIEFLIEDSQYQVPLAVRATNKLIQRDKVFAMLLNLGTAQVLAGYEITDKAGIPNLFPLTGARAIADPYHPHHFSLMASYQDQAEGALKYYNEEIDLNAVCVQSQSSEYGEEVLRGIEEASEELGLEIAMVGRHRTTESEFTGAATALANADCDLIYLGTTGRDTIALYVTLRQMGVEVPIVGNLVSYLPVVAQAAGGAMEGFTVVSPLMAANWDEGGPVRKQFYENFQAEFGEVPSVQAQFGYVGADIFLKAMEHAGPDLTVDSLINAIETMGTYEDPFGGPNITLTAEKRFGTETLGLMEVQDKEWVTLDEDLPY